MSIAAAENAGLSPCEIPEHWANLSSTTTSATSTIQTNTTTNNFISLQTNTSSNENQNSNSNISGSTTKATSTLPQHLARVTFSNSNSTTSNTGKSSLSVAATSCNLPRSSPAAATAAVSISTGGGGANIVPESLVPTLAGFVPLTTTSSASGGGGSNLLITTTPPTTPANVTKNLISNNLFTLQQHQLNNNNNNIINNNNKNLLNNNNFQHKAATPANFAAALQRHPAIMNAVASPISANSATSNRKIRRKNDSKANLPQSQINKCNNEKRRRELENNYIEQLSEFLQLNKRGDMTSTKPDKAAILNQVVKTYRDICDKGHSRDITPSTVTNSNSTSTPTTSSLSTTTTTATNNTSTTNSSSNNPTQPKITSTRCIRCATDNCSIHPVQQGEVSSTEPPLPEHYFNGQAPEISAYFEALEHYISSVGWVLLQIDAKGIIESCTQNIRELIGYEKQELHNKPLYMYLYPEDHVKLDPIINNMSYSGNGSNGGGNLTLNNNNNNISSGGSSSGEGHGASGGSSSLWGEASDEQNNGNGPSSMGSCSATVGGNKTSKRSISTKVRMLVKDMRSSTQTSSANTQSNDAMNQKALRQEKYEEVVLIAAPVKDDGDSSSSVLCLITRPEDESPLEMNIQQHVQQQPIEQMSFKLDIYGKILNLDVTALRDQYKQHLSSWQGRLLQDLCHPQDLSTFKTHLRDVKESVAGVNIVNASQSPGGGSLINPPISNVISRPFRLQMGTPDVYVHVKANSRLFLNQTPGESDFIMSVQTLLNTENDMNSNNTSITGLTQMGSSGLISGNIANMSAMSPLVPSLVSSLSMDFISSNNSSSTSPLVGVSNAHMLGGLVGGGGMPTQNSQGTTNVGGPLMTSAVINGTSGSSSGGPLHRSSASTNASNNSSLVNSFAASPAGPEAPSFDSFEFDLQHSSFDMTWTDSRPNSRASVSTPRPPSTGHGFSPAVCPSPSTPYQLSSHSANSLPSPQSNASQPSYGFGFPSFDTSDQKEKDQMNNNNNNNKNNNNMQMVVPNGLGSNSLLGVGQNMTTGMSGSGSSSTTQTAPQQSQPEQSERLRHLLTTQTSKTHSMTSSSLHLNEGDDRDLQMQKFCQQGLLNSDDDKGGNHSSGRGSSLFKTSSGGMSSFFESSIQKPSNSNNRMLLSLLKSDDEEGKALSNRSNEVLRHLQKDDGHHAPPNNLSDEDLKRMLKIQNDPGNSRKRSLNEPDDGITAKRSEDRPSKLCEQNKMLASLLKKPATKITLNAPPTVKTIPDINPSALGNVSSTLGGPGTPVGVGIGMSSKSSTQTNATRGSGSSGRKQTSDVYLNQQQQASQSLSANLQQRPQQTQLPPNSQSQQNNFGSVGGGSNSSGVVGNPNDRSFATPSHNTTASTSNANIISSQLSANSGDGDPELSKILDSVMDYVPDDQMPHVLSSNIPNVQQELAISAIQKSLMVETSAFGGTNQQQQHQQLLIQLQQQSQPPAYPGNIMSGSTNMTPQQHQQQQQIIQLLRNSQNSGNQQQQQQASILEAIRGNQAFQRPPPLYTARGRGPMNAVAIPGGGVMASSQQFRIRQQHQIAAQQKERLLQQQQKQQLLVPENATARGDPMLGLPPNLNNIGSLLNNTVAPNVSLSRTNLPTDSQLSPNFAQSLMQQQLSPGQRNTPFSPQPNQSYPPQFTQNTQRLSPQQQHGAASAQQQMAFQNQNSSSNVASQLSPRQPPSFGNTTGGNTNVQSPGMPNSSSQQWANSSNNTNVNQRNHSLQTHNPMLSAQLQNVGPYNARQFQNQRRGLNSPGAAGVPGGSPGPATASLQRQNSFQSNDSIAFGGPPNSPSPQSPYGNTGSNVFQQQQMQRMQRQASIPQATQHLPGSPRPFGNANSYHDNASGMNSISTGAGGNFSGMFFNVIQSSNDIYGRSQTAGSAPQLAESIKQSIRAVVCGRQNSASNTANSTGNGVPTGGGGVNGPGGGGGGSLRVTTPQSPLAMGNPSQQQHQPGQQGPILVTGVNSTNSLTGLTQQMQQAQTPGGGNSSDASSTGNSLHDPTLGFPYEAPSEFFGTTR